MMADRRVRQAFDFVSKHEPEIEADQIRLTCIPAPPFGESERAAIFVEEMRSIGLRPISDAVGNVIASYDRTGPNPLVIAAHLDTVFPASTPLQLRRRGNTLLLPGISDNGCGLVGVLWSIRALKNAGLRFRRPVIAAGNVGEEGAGNLRGIRHIFAAPPWDGRACEFITVDGSGLQRITHRALGSRRYRIRMSGPGGHSWADFGRPNPVHAMAIAIHSFISKQTRRRPGTSFNVGVIRGGISVNAIPSETTIEVDLRATAQADLDVMDEQLRRAVGEAVAAEGVESKISLMGKRPSGETSASSRIVQAALEVTHRLGGQPQLDIGSTDANVPMSLGIPAIAIGAGGSSGDVHTSEEWFDPAHRDLGLHRLIALIAVIGELE